MRFIANISFKPEHPSSEYVHLVPKEQARIAELSAAGTVGGVYLAADMKRAWLILSAASEAAAQEALNSLPLHPYMNIELVPLMEPRPQ